jgi:hypothetical protein
MADRFFVGGSASEAIGPSPPDATLLQIGRLTYRLGLFENVLGLKIRNWLPAETAPEIETIAKWPTAQKIARGKELAHLLTNLEARAMFLDALTAAERAYEVRNHILHGSWQIDPVAERAVSLNPARGQTERLVGDVDVAAADADKALRNLFKSMGLEAGVEIPFPVPFFSQRPPWSKEPA